MTVLSLWGSIAAAPGARDLKYASYNSEGQHEFSVGYLNHGKKTRVIFRQLRRSTRAITAKIRLGSFAGWKAESFSSVRFHFVSVE